MRSQDFQHYRSMTRLVDSPITDPVPVATNNLAVLKHQAYESVFDFLAYKGHRIEQIPKMAQQETGSPSHAEWVRLNTVIEEAAREICQISPSREPISISPQCDDYIRRASRVHQPDIRADAAKVAAKHLLLFLEEMPAGVTVIQWLASLNAGQTLNVPDPNAHYWSMFENFVSPNTIQGVKNAMDQDSQDVLEAFVQRMNDALSLRDVDAVKSVAEEFARWAESLSGPNKTSAEAPGMWSAPATSYNPHHMFTHSAGRSLH